MFRLTLFKDVFIASGSGVGGGPRLREHPVPRAAGVLSRPAVGELADWEDEMRPHYDTAERMLGVVDYEGMTPADELLREYGAELGVAGTFKPTRVGVFFGEAGRRSRTPTSTARGPRGPGACAAGAAWWAAATAPRTRW